jgi:transcriptional regulator with XRE-family HTH domain
MRQDHGSLSCQRAVAFLSHPLYLGFMGFVGLQEALRRELRRRIAAGELTGMELARKTGFTQAHISNFINRKRGLKLRALDRMLKALGMTLYDLLDPRDLARHAAIPPVAAEEFVDVPVVEAAAASTPVIVREQVREMLKFRRTFLDRLRAAVAAGRKGWTRFIALQIEAAEAEAMWPGAGARVTLLVDRHSISLAPYRPGRRNIYVVKRDSGLMVRYAESIDGSLVLQPRDPGFPAIVMSAASLADTVIGRVAQVSLKTA